MAYTNQTKNTASYSNQTRNVAFDDILMESGDAILMETAASDTSWTNISKN